MYQGFAWPTGIDSGGWCDVQHLLHLNYQDMPLPIGYILLDHAPSPRDIFYAA